MNETFAMSHQQLREMALNAMLLAVDAQSAALKSMDREHSLGLENSYSVDRVREKCRDLVQSAQIIVKGGESLCLNETRDKLRSMSTVVGKIKEEVDRFKEQAQPKARARYAHLETMLGVVVEPKPESADAPKASDASAGQAPTTSDVAAEPKKLTAQAGYACLRAEVDEFEAFAMQVHAICNLTLEY
ncbi:MAG: hypothetical protein K2X27_00035, partial [Candidatus Obscuribacterales bacterium]|nr:hypothetical protein [Candidatus Obscuribacterales bacterium]